MLTTPEHAEAAADAAAGARVLAAADPLRALQRLATAWRRELGARVIGVTGSTGKTSTKDLLLALLAPHRRTVASRANFNTEIGLPLEILAAPAGTEVLVLEMAMRGAGQIAELAAIAEPDVGVIVSIGPVHLELLGTVEAIAARQGRADRCAGPGATAVVPAGEPLLDPHLRDDVRDGHVRRRRRRPAHRADGRRARRDRRAGASRSSSRCPSTRPICGHNLLAAVRPRRGGRCRRRRAASSSRLSAGRGQRVELPGRDHGDRRLLQRQPDVDAGRPRRSGRDRRARRRGASRRRARRHARARAAEASFHAEIGALASRRGRRPAGHRRAAGRGDRRAHSGRGPIGGRRRRGSAAWSPGCSGRATWCWSRARAALGCELVLRRARRRGAR